jgi:predicted outer membrane protein
MAEMLGNDLSELASRGIVSATVKTELQEGREAAKQVANLVLFGPKADRVIKKDDTPIVQLLKEMGRLYDEAYANGDVAMTQKYLTAISTVLAQHETKAATRMNAALKLLIEQAKFRVKMMMHGGEEAPTVADLEQMIQDQDAKAIIKAAEAADAAGDGE